MDLDRMRKDYADAVRWLRCAHVWNDRDIADLEVSVKAAVARNDAHELACWAKWLAMYAKDWRDWVASVRAAEEECRRLVRADNAARVVDGFGIGKSKGRGHDGSDVRRAA